VTTSTKRISDPGPVAIEIEYQEAHHYTRAFLTHIVLATNLLVIFNGVLFAGVAALGDTLLSLYQGADPRVLGLLRSIAWGLCLMGVFAPVIVCFFCYRMLQNIRLCLTRTEDLEGSDCALSSGLRLNFERAKRPVQVFFLYCCFCIILALLWMVVLWRVLQF